MPNNIDSALMAAFGLTRRQLEETDELQVGFMPEEDRFEIVVRYNGNLENILRQIPGAQGEVLTDRYAILSLTEEQIYQIAALPQIEYVEKPKALLASDVGALRSSCIPTVQLPTTYDLHGAGTLIGIMDSGIDYMHPAFIAENGESRIAALWDQTLDGEQFFTKEQITAAIGSDDPYSIVPSRDTLGHGTQVAGVAAGNGRGSGGRIKGVADQAELIIVKLTENPGYGFSKTTSAMRALKYIIETAREMGKPVAVNVSMGTNMGGHDGQSLFESYIDDWSTSWINSLVVAVGNEGNAARHTSGVLVEGEQDKIEVQVGEGRGSILFQIWKEFADRFYINVGSPSGENTGFVREGGGAFVTIIDGTQVLIYFGEPNPYSGASTIFINLFSEGTVRPGLWSIYLQGESVLDGEYNVWMTGVDGNRGNTYFLTPDAQTTITMPVTARSVLGVTAYNHVTGAIAPFSGQGYSRGGQIIRPDLAAPGVDVLTAMPGGSYGEASGTSIAAPFVTGAAALLMEWGIVRGNDTFLYGERLKALLTAGADRSFSTESFPNRVWGYGKLCLSSTMQRLTEFQTTMVRQEAENCREIISSDQYMELVYTRRADGQVPIPAADAVCQRNLGENEVLVYVRIPEFDQLYPLYTFLSWERLPVLYSPAADVTALDASGITQAQEISSGPLTGSGVIIGIVDTGIDYLHPAFRYEDGTSKILSIWDQSSAEGDTPESYPYGQEFTREQINEALQSDAPYTIVSQRDTDGHGTYVAGAAAGRADVAEGFSGAAPDADLIIVKLKDANPRLKQYYGVPQDQPAFQHTDIQQGVSYIVEQAGIRPLVILVPLSSSFGPHDGYSNLEQALESYQRRAGTVIVTPAGNQGDTSMHTSGTLTDQNDVEFFVGENEETVLMTVWMPIPDQFSISLTTPRGYVIERIPRGVGGYPNTTIPVENTVISVTYLLGMSWNGQQAAIIRLENPTSGLWRLRLYGDNILDGRYNIYMGLKQWNRPDTRFLQPDPATTVTLPGTAPSVLTVGGYNHLNDSLYPPSGRGPTRTGLIKPEIAAPAVNIFGPISPAGYQARSGTSGAAALTAGACAQILQWAIPDGNMIRITQANLKAMLGRGATRRPETTYPNNSWGFGQLDVIESLEES